MVIMILKIYDKYIIIVVVDRGNNHDVKRRNNKYCNIKSIEMKYSIAKSKKQSQMSRDNDSLRQLQE